MPKVLSDFFRRRRIRREIAWQRRQINLAVIDDQIDEASKPVLILSHLKMIKLYQDQLKNVRQIQAGLALAQNVSTQKSPIESLGD